jgi:hypothetical protein
VIGWLLMAAAVARIYAAVMRAPALLALLAGLALALVALAACGTKNEAIVCSSKTENVLAGCKATYNLCSGGTDVLDCSTPEGSGVHCQCLENGVKAKDFHSDDACNVSPDTLKLRAHDGCGWTLD